MVKGGAMEWGDLLLKFDTDVSIFGYYLFR